MNQMPQIFHSLGDVPAGFGPSVAVIGNFDGVHRGHREVLSAVTAEARGKGYRAVAITFDPHPEQFLRPEKAPRLLTPVPERVRMMAQAGNFTSSDAILVLRFDEALACMSALECVKEILVHKLDVRSIHE